MKFFPHVSEKGKNLNSDLIDVKLSHDVGCLVGEIIFYISRYDIQSKVPKFLLFNT